MNKIKYLLPLVFAVFFFASGLTAQQSYTVNEAIDYAVKNHANVKNANLDILNASARVSEIKAMGLPHLNSNVNYTNNFQIARVFLPAKTFDPTAKEGDVIAAKFGVAHSGNAGISLSQLIFDGSYTLGLRAADVYKELSTKTLVQTKQQIAENVAKAYYAILVNDERIKLLQTNIGRLDSLIRDTKAMNVQGFVEKLDVQRLEVQANNLKTETKNIERLQELGQYLLKFQMGLNIEEPITLKDKLSEISINEIQPSELNEFKYASRMEYSILQTQQRLAELDLKNQKATALPRVTLNGNYGYNTGRPGFSDLITKPWFSNGNLGLGVQIPIFDGFARKYKTIQSENNLQKLKNSYSLLENTIDMQIKQANISLKNSWESLQENQKNMDLAKEIVRVSKIKYKQGVGTNLEVLNAEAALKESQTNYFTSLYNALIAKVDLDKAQGKLYN
ncbi:MAG: TolC family protein [Bacteroidota bacterium]